MKKEYLIENNELPNLQVYKWIPEERSEQKGVIQIVHGMMEYAGRYDEFAQYLSSRGYIVYAHDHPGHGKSVNSEFELGHMPENGWNILLIATGIVRNEIEKDNPGIPVVLFGHSMGSVLARHCVLQQTGSYDALILSGPTVNPPLLSRIGSTLSKLSIALQGRNHRNSVLSYLVYGRFKNPFRKELITDFDWLSRDEEKVNEYVESPLCGFPNTSGFYHEMFKGFLQVETASWPPFSEQFPVYIIAGKMDPVGKFGLDAELLKKKYLAGGLNNVSLKLYKEARHEMLNEINREDVFQDIYEWLEGNC